MRKPIIGLAALLLSVSTHGVLAGQAPRFRGDSTIAELMHVDSTSRLVLSVSGMMFEYTARGIDRARRRADSSVANTAIALWQDS